MTHAPRVASLILIALSLGSHAAYAGGDANRCDLAIAAAYAENDALREHVSDWSRGHMRSAETYLREFHRTYGDPSVVPRTEFHGFNLLTMSEEHPTAREWENRRRDFEDLQRDVALAEEAAALPSDSASQLRREFRIQLRRFAIALALPEKLQRILNLDSYFVMERVLEWQSDDAALRFDLDTGTITSCAYDEADAAFEGTGIRAVKLCSTVSLLDRHPRITHDLQWLRPQAGSHTSSALVPFSLIEERLSRRCERRLASRRLGPSPVVGSTSIHLTNDEGRAPVTGGRAVLESGDTRARAAH